MFLKYLWERYFFKETAKIALFFIAVFYAFFILLDYAINARSFHKAVELTPLSIALYYGCSLVRYLDALLPVALLLATTHCLYRLNEQHLLTALRCAGWSLQRLAAPFLLLAALSLTLLYIDSEWVLPKASRYIKYAEDLMSRSKRHHLYRQGVQRLYLSDASILLYRQRDATFEEFREGYWLQSPSSIYRFNALRVEGGQATGFNVDHFSLDEEGRALLEGHFNKLLFDTLPPLHLAREEMPQAEELGLSALWHVIHSPATLAEQQAQGLALWHYRLAAPWLCVIAVLTPFYLCTRPQRASSPFIIYASLLFFILSLYLFLDAAFLLSQRQIWNPLWAIWIPTVAAAALCLYFFFKAR